MDTHADWYSHFVTSAHRFAEHYLAHTQDHMLDLLALDEEVDNLFHALATYRSRQAWLDIAKFVNALDIFLDTRGYWTELRSWLEQVARHLETIDDPVIRLDVLLNLASVTSSQGDRMKAEELYHQAIELSEQVEYRTRLGIAYYGLYTVYLNQGRPDMARECLEQTLALAQQGEDQTLENAARCFLVVTDLSEGVTESSPRILNAIDQLAKDLGPSDQVFTSSLRAWTFSMLGMHNRARQSYERVLKRLREDGDAQGTALVLYQLGLLSALEDDLASALNRFLESESIVRKIGDHTGLMLVCPSTGLVYLRQNRFDLALPYLEESVALARLSGDESEVAKNLFWLGYAVANTGSPQQAEVVFQESLAIYEQMGSSEVEKVRRVLSKLQTTIDSSQA